MSDIAAEDTKKKLLSLSPFPTLQTVVNMCRADETAENDAKQLNKIDGLAVQRMGPKTEK